MKPKVGVAVVASLFCAWSLTAQTNTVSPEKDVATLKEKLPRSAGPLPGEE